MSLVIGLFVFASLCVSSPHFILFHSSCVRVFSYLLVFLSYFKCFYLFHDVAVKMNFQVKQFWAEPPLFSTVQLNFTCLHMFICFLHQFNIQIFVCSVFVCWFTRARCSCRGRSRISAASCPLLGGSPSHSTALSLWLRLQLVLSQWGRSDTVMQVVDLQILRQVDTEEPAEFIQT